MVETHNAGTIKRNILHVAHKRIVQVFKTAVMLQMFGVDIGDNAHGRGQTHKSAVAFIGFNHHPVARTKPRIGAIGIDNATIDNGRIEPRSIKHGGD